MKNIFIIVKKAARNRGLMCCLNIAATTRSIRAIQYNIPKSALQEKSLNILIDANEKRLERHPEENIPTPPLSLQYIVYRAGVTACLVSFINTAFQYGGTGLPHLRFVVSLRVTRLACKSGFKLQASK